MSRHVPINGGAPTCPGLRCREHLIAAQLFSAPRASTLSARLAVGLLRAGYRPVKSFTIAGRQLIEKRPVFCETLEQCNQLANARERGFGVH